jgi:hypothetical protein
MGDSHKAVKAGRPAFFRDPETDRLLAIVVRLMTEHSVLSERVKALEAILADAGIVTPESLEAFQPNDEQEAQWAQARFQLIKDVLESGANVSAREEN